MTLKELKAMPLHSVKVLMQKEQSSLMIFRVAGGWLYESMHGDAITETFVPEPKESGVKDGVCVWKKDNTEYSDFYNITCKENGMCAVDDASLYSFCPYCGRRIEVVE